MDPAAGPLVDTGVRGGAHLDWLPGRGKRFGYRQLVQIGEEFGDQPVLELDAAPSKQANAFHDTHAGLAVPPGVRL
ncbi:hypothetical protein [Streptomyces sp. NPDC051994]|uniref:hypothetical protein n=1 Tax=unclassified Streptomyces TaxID=2593676 RepID=UPI003444A37B